MSRLTLDDQRLVSWYMTMYELSDLLETDSSVQMFAAYKTLRVMAQQSRGNPIATKLAGRVLADLQLTLYGGEG